jgi:hypothetical protein
MAILVEQDVYVLQPVDIGGYCKNLWENLDGENAVIQCGSARLLAAVLLVFKAGIDRADVLWRDSSQTKETALTQIRSPGYLDVLQRLLDGGTTDLALAIRQICKVMRFCPEFCQDMRHHDSVTLPKVKLMVSTSFSLDFDAGMQPYL